MIRRLLTVAGLTALAVAQPVLDVFGDSPATFRVHRVEGRSILLFALIVVVVPPILLWLGGEVARYVNGRAGELVHLGTVVLLMGVFGTLFAKEFSDVAALNLIVGLAIAAGAGLLYARYDAFGLWLRILAFANVFFLFQFAFVAPVAEWIDSGTDEAVALQPTAADGGEVDTATTLPSVAMIVLDEFPTQSLLADDGGIDDVRFPNLSAFARDATWYPRFTTTSPFTQTAVPALLAGTDPTGSPTWVDHPDNLFSLLAGTHHLIVSEALTQMCGFDECGARPVPPPPPSAIPGEPTVADLAPIEIDTGPEWGALFDTAFTVWTERVRPGRTVSAPAFDDFEEEIGELPPGTDDEATDDVADDDEATDEGAAGGPSQDERTEEEIELDRFLATLVSSQPVRHQAFVDALRPTDVPIFGYLHLILPHQPWTLREDGTPYEVAADRTDYEADHDDPWPARVGQQRHLLQAEYADRLVGIVLDRLREVDLYDDTAIVVLSDHGVAFEPGQSSRSLTDDNLAAIAYPPLLIKAPGQRAGRIDDANVNITDVTPTVASLVGLALPWEAVGAAADSPAVVARGSEKYIYDYSDAFEEIFLGVREFDDDTRFAELESGRPASISTDESRVSGLYRTVPGAELIGDAADLHFVGAGSTAQVAALDRLRNPPADRPLLGEIAGRVPGAPDDAVVVVAVDDRIVGVSPLYTRGGNDDSFVVVVDDGVLTLDGNEVRLGLRSAAGDITELLVEATG